MQRMLFYQLVQASPLAGGVDKGQQNHSSIETGMTGTKTNSGPATEKQRVWIHRDAQLWRSLSGLLQSRRTFPNPISYRAEPFMPTFVM